MSMGHNTITGQQLRSYIERLERIAEEKAALGADYNDVLSEAKGNGFDKTAIKECLKIRAMRPDDRANLEAMVDLYLDAIGMRRDPGPLFKIANLASFDATAREQVIARMGDFVPGYGLGDVVVNMGGQQVRLLRGPDGKVIVQPVAAPAPEPAKPPKPPKPADETKHRPAAAPEVDEAGATELGRQFARDNRPVTHNPFPFGDARRPRFDEGWRAETGNDGMGPNEPGENEGGDDGEEGGE